MIEKNKPHMHDRRKHVRLPIIHGILEPVNLVFEDPRAKGGTASQPAILSNLSAGGLRLMTFLEPPKTQKLDLHLDLPGLGKVPIKGRISWVRGKGGVFMSGIAFTSISKPHCQKINAMAEDYADCETRIGLKLPEVCVPNCKCHHLCNKPQKDLGLFDGREPQSAPCNCDCSGKRKKR